MGELFARGVVSREFAKILFAVAETYRMELSEALIRTYAQALDDLTLDQVRTGCAAAVRESKWFPQVAEIRRAVCPSVDEAAILAWAAVERAVAKVGPYTPLIVDDGSVAAAIEAVWGTWPALCHDAVDGAAWGARRTEFLAAYRQARRGPALGPVRMAGTLDASTASPDVQGKLLVGRLSTDGLLQVGSVETLGLADALVSGGAARLESGE